METCEIWHLYESSELWYSKKKIQYYCKPVLTASWNTYKSNLKKRSLKIMLGVNQNVIVNSDSNLEQVCLEFDVIF